MKKSFWIIIAVFAVVFIGLTVLFAERALHNSNKEVVNPVAVATDYRSCMLQPGNVQSVMGKTKSCAVQDGVFSDMKADLPQTNDLIKVESIKSGDKVSFPLTITGQARGQWYFEASFPVNLIDKDGKIIASTVATAKDEWMTDKFVPFETTFDVKEYLGPATILFMRDNASGLPENEDGIYIPITIVPAEKSTIKVFFSNNKKDTNTTYCDVTYPVAREIQKTEAVARAALEELLKGPTEKEKADGYFTSINDGVKIQKLTIENGTAKVDFNKQLEFQVGGSCKVAAISGQIRDTLMQFSTVKNVIISIDGRTEDILQP